MSVERDASKPFATAEEAAAAEAEASAQLAAARKRARAEIEAANQAGGAKRRSVRDGIAVVMPFLPPGAKVQLVVISIFSFVSGLMSATILALLVNTALGIANGTTSKFDVPVLGSVTLDVPTSIFVGLALLGISLTLDMTALHMSATIAARTYSGLRQRVHRSFLRSTWKVQSESGEGQLQDLVSTYVPQESTAVLLVTNGLIAVTTFSSLLIVAVLLNAVAAFLVVLTVGVLFVCFRPVGIRTRRHSENQLMWNARYVGEISQGVRLAQAIRAFNVTEVWARRDDELATETAHHFRLKTRLRGAIGPLYTAVALAMLLLALAGLYASDVSNLASLGALILILLRAVNSGQTLQGVYQALIENMPYAVHLTDELTALEAAEQPRGSEPIDAIRTLGMSDVTFSYVADHQALRGISFEIAHGESIGIVGPSGGGKSTLVQLLLRLRDPDTGSVLANGSDVRDLSLDDWYRHIAFVPQEPLLTSGTVRENIEFFRDDLPEGAVERAARQAHIHHDIAGWPDGYETSAGARGAGLSGGQRQRLCIARALASNPEILILDEPTSALDVNAEAIVRDTLEELHGKATIILVAHRLSTLRLCDKIMVIDGGRITAFEPTSDLANREGFYRHALEQSDR